MKHTIIAAALLGLLASGQARADPKTITIDGCTKIEIGPQNACLQHTCVLNPALKTVKCTGEANDPKVREEQALTGPLLQDPGIVLGGSSICIRGDSNPC